MKAASLGSIKNNKGQFAIEAVLLMTVLIGIFLAVTNQIKSKGILQNFVSKPMDNLGRMAGYGTWQKECIGQGKSTKLALGKCHPNSIQRSLSSNPN